jgi:formate/nitrite transporter FocA (FNT family)
MPMPPPRDIVAIMLAGIVVLFICLSAWITLAGGVIDDKAVLMWKDLFLTIVGGLVGYISGSASKEK